MNFHEAELEEAIDAILKFRDHNYKDGTPIYNFWP